MNENIFWNIIDLIDFSLRKSDQIFEKAKYKLASLDERAIQTFADILSAKLFMLDTREHAENIGEDAYTEDSYFSVDLFLYARCYVVARGKNFFERVLDNPKSFPQDVTFEHILYLPYEAYELKTGKSLDYIASVSYETFSNAQGWGDTEHKLFDLHQILAA